MCRDLMSMPNVIVELSLDYEESSLCIEYPVPCPFASRLQSFCPLAKTSMWQSARNFPVLENEVRSEDKLTFIVFSTFVFPRIGPKPKLPTLYQEPEDYLCDRDDQSRLY